MISLLVADKAWRLKGRTCFDSILGLIFGNGNVTEL